MNTDAFALRHIGPRKSDLSSMLDTVGVSSMNELIYETIPDNIKLDDKLTLDPALSEQEFASHMQDLASKTRLKGISVIMLTWFSHKSLKMSTYF